MLGAFHAAMHQHRLRLAALVIEERVAGLVRHGSTSNEKTGARCGRFELVTLAEMFSGRLPAKVGRTFAVRQPDQKKRRHCRAKPLVACNRTGQITTNCAINAVSTELLPNGAWRQSPQLLSQSKGFA
jgi:hypothetical protein